MIKVILFDLDDTLYPQQQYFRSGFFEVSHMIEMKYGISHPDFFLTLITLFNQNRNAKVFDEALAHYGVDPRGTIAKVLKKFREHKPFITLYPSAYMILEELHKRFRLGMITDEKEYLQIKKIRKLKIEHFFEHIIYTHEYDHYKRKPSKYPYILALDYFEVQPESMLYIGNDPRTDFIGAREVGMKTLRICQGRFYNIHFNRKLEADYRVSSLKHALTLINTLTN